MSDDEYHKCDDCELWAHCTERLVDEEECFEPKDKDGHVIYEHAYGRKYDANSSSRGKQEGER